MVVLPRELVRKALRRCSALRRVWMDVFAVLALVSVSTRGAHHELTFPLARSFVSLEQVNLWERPRASRRRGNVSRRRPPPPSRPRRRTKSSPPTTTYDIPGAAPVDEELNALFDEAADKAMAMGAIVEELIDVGSMVETQVFRLHLHKREVAAAACREAMEAQSLGTGGKGSRLGERAPHGLRRTVYSDALGEFEDIYDECGIIECPTCGNSPVYCNMCRVDCACGTRHLRYAGRQGYRCGLRRSPGSPFIGE